MEDRTDQELDVTQHPSERNEEATHSTQQTAFIGELEGIDAGFAFPGCSEALYL